MGNYVPEKFRLTEYIKVRFSADEKKYLKQQADAAGITLSELIRRRLYGIRIASRAETQTFNTLIVIRNQLAKLGGLFKHLYTMNPIYSKETAEALQFAIKNSGEVEAMIRILRNDFERTEKMKLNLKAALDKAALEKRQVSKNDMQNSS